MNPIAATLRVLGLAAVLASTLPAGDAPETVVVENGALRLRGLYWRPSGDSPGPAVLFNHGSGPASNPSVAMAVGTAFSRRGYAFLYLYRRGAGLSADQGTNSGALMARALAEGGQQARNQLQLELQQTELSDVAAGLAYLRGQHAIDERRIAVIGHSFGGQLALLLTERDAGPRAVVVFGAAARSWENSPALRTRLLSAVRGANAPVFFIHAANDHSLAPGTQLAAELNRLGKPHLVKIYPAFGSTAAEGHGFVYSGFDTWAPDVFEFLRRQMPR